MRRIGDRRFLFAGVFAALWLIATAAGGAQAQDPEREAPPADRAPTLDELLRLIELQQRQIEQQTLLIEEQQKRIDELNELLEALQDRLREMEARAAVDTDDEALEERIERLERSVEKIPEIPQDVVSAGDFPGSIRIPGTDAALKIGGLVRMTLVHNFDALGVDDRFVTALIPIEGSEEAGKGPRTTLSARPSRFNFDFRSPTEVGDMRAFIEGDFAGSGNVLRLRHAYGQWWRLLVGQTWSTFADPEAEPDGIDFEGLNAISLFRQTQIRWTQSMGENLGLAIAIENPDPDVTGAAGISRFPDLIARFRRDIHTPREGHLHFAVLLRQLRAEPFDRPNEETVTGGWGLNASGSINTPAWASKDNIKFAAYLGAGIGSYITDLDAAGGQDAVYDEETDSLKALPIRAAYLGYQHWWTERLRSTATYGVVYVENLDIQAPDAYHQTRRWTLNLAWSPIARLDIVGELLGGERIDNDRQRGEATQIQIGTTFRF